MKLEWRAHRPNDRIDPTMTETDKRDYSETLNLPQTDFPMRAGLPKKEPEILARWEKLNVYKKLREQGRPGQVHPSRRPALRQRQHPYRPCAQQDAEGHRHPLDADDGLDSNYVPGWDCHGLPIEWKIEEQYRAKGKNKDEVPINEFRKECRSSPSTGSTCSARSSSASASRATGTTPI
jgi:isoleucyl-tRNA synthetase